MKYTALLTKMSSNYENPVKYYLKTENETLLINDYLDRSLKIEFTGEVYCISCGKKIKKTFGQGYSFHVFLLHLKPRNVFLDLNYARPTSVLQEI